jgi:hypothetical protein
MTAMSERLIDLVDLIVYRVPTPAQLARMSDADAERLYMEALAQDKQRRASVLGAHIDRKDLAARLARDVRVQRTRRQEATAAAHRAERVDYEAYVEAEFQRAERHCRGHLLSAHGMRSRPDGSPVITDAKALWRGPEASARKAASEELRGYWDDISPRLTFAEWKRQSRETYDPTATAAA